MLKLIQPIDLLMAKSTVRYFQNLVIAFASKQHSHIQHKPQKQQKKRISNIVNDNTKIVWPRKLHINQFVGNSNTKSPSNNGDVDVNVETTLRWGIAPVSLMADDFGAALSILPPQRHQIVSCVAAYRSHAEAFADKYNVENIYTSFEDLANCPNVDVVYISPLNPLHGELCHLMLNHDKHVLCEKPLCMTEDQVRQLISKAQARGLFLMEGMWPRCVPAYHYLRKQILRNRLGEVSHVHCTLGLPVSQSKLALYGGVASDFGIYGLQLALWVFREPPQRVRATGKLNEEDIDVTADIVLEFSRNRWAHIQVSAEEKLENKATITGKDGSIKMTNYWCPTRLTTDRENIDFPLPVDDGFFTHYHNRVSMCYEAEEVRKCILNGCNESEMFNHKESILLANLMDIIYNQLGLGRGVDIHTPILEDEKFQDPSEIVGEAFQSLGFDITTTDGDESTIPASDNKKPEESCSSKQSGPKVLGAP
ncbi:trans-1,2-dihydrobenzene-1,2-diol dehydrogenase [Drosophila willistoni]|uniref:trans-1,2-dihydrobenzene-1,2-diol dehydrogenase n=1 Tax=Drosophila willistoni TaxID=7260 RepID=UPI000C26D61D|nr:trans-1,2-dihydrobenzene-1,2-diol dehydrogenase [Drosophila willistoni]